MRIGDDAYRASLLPHVRARWRSRPGQAVDEPPRPSAANPQSSCGEPADALTSGLSHRGSMQVERRDVERAFIRFDGGPWNGLSGIYVDLDPDVPMVCDDGDYVRAGSSDGVTTYRFSRHEPAS